MSVIKPVLHHVTMKTARLADMVAWYSAVVGAEVQFMNDSAAWLTNDAANHRIAFLSVPGLQDDPQKASHIGMHHSAFEYESFDDLMASYKRLSREGIRPAFCLEHGLTTSLYYRDPDGNFVELQTDVFGDWSVSGEWMRTSPDFAANPIGAFFDAEKVWEAHHSGADYPTLQKAMRAGQFQPERIPDIGLPPPPAS